LCLRKRVVIRGVRAQVALGHPQFLQQLPGCNSSWGHGGEAEG
jgi:hypothetical protein